MTQICVLCSPTAALSSSTSYFSFFPTHFATFVPFGPPLILRRNPPNEKKFRFSSSFRAFSRLFAPQTKRRLENSGSAPPPSEGALHSAESLNPLKSMRLRVPPTASSGAPAPSWGAPADFFLSFENF